MTTTTHRAAAPTRRGRVWHATLWILQIATAAGFALAAAGKLTGNPQMVATFHAIGLGGWLVYLVAALELLGAAGLLVPRVTGLAAGALALLMVGAVLTQAVVVGGGVLLPIPYLLAAAVIAWGRRDATAYLWSRVAPR